MKVQDFVSKKIAQFKKSNIIQVKDIGRKGKHFFVREAYTFLPQTDLAEKVFILERLRKESTEGSLAYSNWKKGDIEYRIGYFIKGQIGKAKDRWIWGQYCPLIPQEDLIKLLNKARTDGTLVNL